MKILLSFLILLLIILIIVASVQAQKLWVLRGISKIVELDVAKEFEDFIRIYERKYASLEEKELRFSIFTNNLMYYDSVMRRSKTKPVRYFAQYSDLTNAEV
jgi:hypothetical protein